MPVLRTLPPLSVLRTTYLQCKPQSSKQTLPSHCDYLTHRSPHCSTRSLHVLTANEGGDGHVALLVHVVDDGDAHAVVGEDVHIGDDRAVNVDNLPEGKALAGWPPVEAVVPQTVAAPLGLRRDLHKEQQTYRLQITSCKNYIDLTNRIYFWQNCLSEPASTRT